MNNTNDRNHLMSGRYYSFIVDGGRWSFVCRGWFVGVASQGKGYAKGSATETGEATYSIAGQSVESGVVGGQSERSRRRDDLLVSRDEASSRHDV